MPRVSVCITHYNRPHKLAATLESLADQTRVPDEVFLWDDCSPNDPTEIALAYKNRFPHFAYHRNERNLNMPGNLNAVLSQATGDYIANLHDADTFEPTLLEKWERILEQNPSAGLAFCGYDVVSAAGRQACVHAIPPISSGRELFSKWFVGNSGSVIWGTVMARKQVYDKLLPFRPHYRNWSDVDMWLRVCRYYDVAYVREPLIALDDTDTPLRQFSWYRTLLLQSLILSTIDEIWSEEAANSVAQRRRQLRVIRWNLLRCSLGALRWSDWERIRIIYPFVLKIWSGKLDDALLEEVYERERERLAQS